MIMDVKDWIELVGQIVQAGLIGAGLIWTVKGFRKTFEYSIQSQKENWRIQILDRAGFEIYRSLTDFIRVMRNLGNALSVIIDPDRLNKLADTTDMTTEDWKKLVKNTIKPYIQEAKLSRDVLDHIQYYKFALLNLNTDGYIDKFLLELDVFNDAFNKLKNASLHRNIDKETLADQIRAFLTLFNSISQSISVFRTKVGEHCLTQVFHDGIPKL